MGDKKKQLTIKDIARMVGVSVATVSNALSGQRHVKEETKRKIFEVTEKYCYTPNIIARGLCKKKTGIIGIILPDINNPFYAEVVKGIDEEVKKRDYLTVVVSTYYDDEVEIAQLNKLGSMFVDGYIFVGGSCGFEKVISSVSNMGGFVLINRYCKNSSYSAVVIDSDKAMKEAVDYLSGKGHRSIGYLGWCMQKIIIPESKYRGYLKGLEDNSIKVDEGNVFVAREIVINQYGYGYDTMNSYTKNNRKPGFTALICQTDIIALGAMRALQNNGLKVPDDVSILGYGSLNAARFSNPAVSSIDLPKRRMGRAGAAVLFDSIDRGSNRKQTVYVKTRIIERESVKSI
ncbi:MAG: LacI family DNA-binding transcriptional regulator [Actinomycetota bacterium]